MFGGLHLLRFQEDKFLLKFGSQRDYEYADGRDYTYHGERVQLGGMATLLWWAMRFKWDFDVHFRHYQDRNVFSVILSWSY
jgi:hypothetical protein